MDDVTELQDDNVLTLSRDVTRIVEDNKGMKALLATSNDGYVLLTSNPHIRQRKDKWHTRMIIRPIKTCLRGKRIKTDPCLTKLGAELKNPHSLKKQLDRIQS